MTTSSLIRGSRHGMDQVTKEGPLTEEPATPASGHPATTTGGPEPTPTTPTTTTAPEGPANPGSPSGWLVGRPRGTCSVTGRPIAPDEPYFAALREADGILERVEYSQEAWAGLDEAERGRLLAFWKTRLPRPEEDRRKLRIDDEVLIELVRRLEDATEPRKLAFRFVLALMLMRKRRLAYEGSTRDDAGEVWLLRLKNAQAHRPPADAEEFRVIDPKLEESQLEEVGQQVGQLLAGEDE